ncbi:MULTISPECIES: Atu4866 domain-containing protein [unclassified Ensifer]|uniref:Atu4866 domain-containing protein n=1 Tax=unclassified Ensifer TaxID=2633371 RepID=UPI0009F6FA53|nr:MULTISPECIES: Atu4866 domain-containing protein [unclassified Ensifer]
MAVFPSRHVAGFSLAAMVACGVAVAASGDARPGEKTRLTKGESEMAEHPYVGMWVTDDGHVRHELLANGRYDEARGDRESAYQGRYAVNGTHIDYWDDTGFTADGVFVDRNTLHHGGMILRRR